MFKRRRLLSSTVIGRRHRDVRAGSAKFRTRIGFLPAEKAVWRDVSTVAVSPSPLASLTCRVFGVAVLEDTGGHHPWSRPTTGRRRPRSLVLGHMGPGWELACPLRLGPLEGIVGRTSTGKAYRRTTLARCDENDVRVLIIPMLVLAIRFGPSEASCLRLRTYCAYVSTYAQHPRSCCTGEQLVRLPSHICRVRWKVTCCMINAAPNLVTDAISSCIFRGIGVCFTPCWSEYEKSFVVDRVRLRRRTAPKPTASAFPVPLGRAATARPSRPTMWIGPGSLGDIQAFPCFFCSPASCVLGSAWGLCGGLRTVRT